MENTKKASKQNKGIIGALCVLLILLILTGAGGYTYAKYMSQEKGTGSADVANWAFDMSMPGTETKTVKLVNIVGKESLVAGKIAPGTTGNFKIVLDSTGAETGTDYTLQFENETNKPSNMTFTCDGKTYKSLTEIQNIAGTIPASGVKKKEIQVAWEWPYQTGTTESEIAKNDKIDTKDGTSLLDYSFDIVATAVQSK